MERLTFDPLITPNGVQSGDGCTIAASEPHVPEHAATHGGTRTNRISAMENEGEDQSRCNSPAESTKIFGKSPLGADPRALREWSNRHRPADEPAPDTGSSGSDGRPCSVPWPDTAVGHARLANAGPPAGRPHCSTASADASTGTASRTPSTGKAAAADDTGRGLEPVRTSEHAEAGPREVPTPERSSRGAERLFRPATPFTRWPSSLHLHLYTGPLKPPSANRTPAPLVPRKWSPPSPPPTRPPEHRQ